MDPRNSTPAGFAYVWQSKWVGKITIKTERTQIPFLSDVLVAVASLDLRVTNQSIRKRCWLGQRGSNFFPYKRSLKLTLRRDCHFWVCGQNPMEWLFKWNISAFAFTWCYLLFKIVRNEIGNFCWILPLVIFGSGRVKGRYISRKEQIASPSQPSKDPSLQPQQLSFVIVLQWKCRRKEVSEECHRNCLYLWS